ncbi:hypothetical protein C8R44DRAFT_603641 [Mycena epipterygia]|nr:hypothetical protein C8R44DRAFT_603641 [Mycena epipterygia]
MLSLCSAPGTTVTSLIDRAKQSACARRTSMTRSRWISVRSSPILISANIASTRAGRNGSDFRVRMLLSTMDGIGGCSTPGCSPPGSAASSRIQICRHPSLSAKCSVGTVARVQLRKPSISGSFASTGI